MAWSKETDKTDTWTPEAPHVGSPVSAIVGQAIVGQAIVGNGVWTEQDQSTTTTWNKEAPI